MRRTRTLGAVSPRSAAAEIATAPSSPAERMAQTRRRKPRLPLVLIDPAPLTRESIAAMFARALPEYVILSGASGDELVRTGATEMRPALVVINTKSASVSDTLIQTILEGVKQHAEGAPIVVLSDRDDVGDVIEALDYGIRGYINPSVEPEVVFAALKLV